MCGPFLWGYCMARGQCFFVWCGCVLSGVLQMTVSWAQVSDATTDNTLVPWQMSAWADEQSVSDGLPVVALDRTDWFRGLGKTASLYSAQRQLQGGLDATHPTGWRVGALARSFAYVQATGGAVTLAAQMAQKIDPAVGVVSNVNAKSWGWSGTGLSVGTPWIPFVQSGQWRWRADAQWLRLSKIRENKLDGTISYQGGTYDAYANATRWGNQITGPFLPLSGPTGWGGSLSLTLEGEPAPHWYLGIRANDILSRLHWASLARETSLINSQITSRHPDGSLNYAALVNGQQSLDVWKKSMDTQWQLDVRHTIRGEQGALGALTWRSTSWGGLDRHWLGWASPARGKGVKWLVAVEPWRHVLSGGLHWRGLSLGLATDGKSKSHTQYRSWSLRWEIPL